MSTFKIGDRVRFKPEYNRTGYDLGTVTAVGGGSDPWARVTFDGTSYRGEWMQWSLELATPWIPPRGPRPLPIRQRVTLTAGRSLRAPAREVWSQVHALHGPRLRDGERSWYV